MEKVALDHSVVVPGPYGQATLEQVTGELAYSFKVTSGTVLGVETSSMVNGQLLFECSI